MENLKTKLESFHGTQNYYKHWTGLLLYTDGVRFLAQEAGAYWLIDAIASYQVKKKVRAIPFQLWELEVKNNEGVLTMKEDCDKPNVVKQEISYTDFPLDKIKLYLIDGILLLPSEY